MTKERMRDQVPWDDVAEIERRAVIREEPYCPECNSNEVVVDSISTWDSDNKEYITVAVSDKPWWCSNKDCDIDEFTSIKWREIK